MRTAIFAPAALLALISSSGVVACSSETRLTLSLTTGGEADALTRAPAPTALEVEAIDSAGAVRPLARVPSPTGSIELGTIDKGTILSVRVRGRDETGRTLVFGQTLPVEIDASGDVALGVFLQRTDEFARLPGKLTLTAPAPLVDRLGGRYVVVASGLRAEIFDLATFTTRGFALTRIPKTIVATATALFTIDDGGAALVDPNGATTTVPAPNGGVFADVVGGALVRGDGGVAYVVGATRAGASMNPSALVLRVADDGSLSFLRLLTARAGAAATFLPGRGLVVLGGSATGAGVEILNDGGALPLPFAALAEANLSAASLDDHRVLVVGGGSSSGGRIVDLSCSANCSLGDWGTDRAPWPESVRTRTRAMARMVDGSIVALADDDGGSSHVFRLRESASPVEIPLRVPHARAELALGVGPSALVVGGATEIESFAIDP